MIIHKTTIELTEKEAIFLMEFNGKQRRISVARKYYEENKAEATKTCCITLFEAFFNETIFVNDTDINKSEQ